MKTLLSLTLLALYLVSCSDLYAYDHASEKKVKNKIAEYLEKEKIVDYKLIDVGDEGLAGQSGDLVYFVKNSSNQIVLVVKAFITEKHAERFNCECRAINFFKHLPIKTIKPIKIVFTHKDKSFHLLGMTPASGKSVLQLMKAVNQHDKGTTLRKQAFQTLLYALENVGSVLGQLHTQKVQPARTVSSREITRYRDFLTSFCKDIKVIRGWVCPLKEKKVKAGYMQLLKAFLNNPHQCCYVHGDAHPGNIFFDATTNKVTFIDVSCTTLYLDEHNNPQGFAANDFCHFLMGVIMVAPDYFDTDEVKAIKKIFSRAYRNRLDSNAARFFALYWTLRRLGTGLEMIKRTGCDNVRYRMLQDQAKAYCKIINRQKMLGV